MEVKLGNSDSFSFSEIQNLKSKNGKFVTFQWIIPLPMFTPVKRLSKVYFVSKASEAKDYAKKYNLINLLIGWWGLPFGPVYLVKSIALNNQGGIDVTDDIYLNLNETDYNNGIVNVVKKSTIFIYPKKSELKEFEKVFKVLLSEKVISTTPTIGYFIDTKKGEQPYYLIGLEQEISKELSKRIEKEIYKRFFKQLQFNLVEISLLEGENKKLITQGLKIKDTNKRTVNTL